MATKSISVTRHTTVFEVEIEYDSREVRPFGKLFRKSNKHTIINRAEVKTDKIAKKEREVQTEEVLHKFLIDIIKEIASKHDKAKVPDSQSNILPGQYKIYKSCSSGWNNTIGKFSTISIRFMLVDKPISLCYENDSILLGNTIWDTTIPKIFITDPLFKEKIEKYLFAEDE